MASSSTPRSLATRRAVVRCCSASNVPRTMLCGLVEPRLLVRMSRTPAHSSTARTGPPALTPAPRPHLVLHDLRHLHHLRPLRDLEPQQAARRALRRHPRAPSPPAQSSRALTARAVLGSPLELQSAFASAVGHRLHAPVLPVAAA